MKRRFWTRSAAICLATAGFPLAGCTDAGEAPLGPEVNSIEGHRVGARHGDETDVLSLADFSVVGTARLLRTHNGVSYVVRTGGLEAGHAYTLWIVIYNETSGCLAGVPDGPPCGPADVVNDAARPDMMWAAGRVSHSGHAVFVGHRRVGDSRGSINGPVGLPAYGLENPGDAQIEFVVHDHGPAIPEFMPDMITTVDGGCTDAGIPEAGVSSPWNDYAFGRRGPNTCGSIQFAAFSP